MAFSEYPVDQIHIVQGDDLRELESKVNDWLDRYGSNWTIHGSVNHVVTAIENPKATAYGDRFYIGYFYQALKRIKPT